MTYKFLIQDLYIEDLRILRLRAIAWVWDGNGVQLMWVRGTLAEVLGSEVNARPHERGLFRVLIRPDALGEGPFTDVLELTGRTQTHSGVLSAKTTSMGWLPTHAWEGGKYRLSPIEMISGGFVLVHEGAWGSIVLRWIRQGAERVG